MKSKPNLVTTPKASTSLSHLAPIVQATKAFAVSSKSANTRRAYRHGWKVFSDWAEANRLESLPARAETIAMFLTYMETEGYSVSTIQQHLAAIVAAHDKANVPSAARAGLVRDVLRGIRRKIGVAPKQKQPILVPMLAAMVLATRDDLMGIRDKAVLLVDFAGAFRRNELASIDFEDIEFVKEGMIITLRRSKTDQEGRGRKVAIHPGQNLDPVSAMKQWLEASGVQSGPVFLGFRNGRLTSKRIWGEDVARIIKRAIVRCGCGDPAKFSGHSMRSGFVTAAAKAGKTEGEVMRQTGHRSVDMLQRYYREANLFQNNATKGIL